MKRKYIEKELKTEAERCAPYSLDEIKRAARAENLLPHESEQDSEIYQQGNTVVKAKIQRKTLGLIAVFAAVIVCLILILSFTLFGKKNSFNPSRINFSAEDVYGMGAVTSVRLLGSTMPASAVKALSAVNATTDTSEDEVKRQAERFNEYFTALDSFLGDDIISTATVKNTDSHYPYDTKMTITGKDINGTTISYLMYYTETLLKDNSEDDEREYKLVGIMVIDGEDYYLEGERSEETEKDETETELKIRAYADVTDKTS
ncbi:MAG: hypothetical protein K2G96_05930, partial [Clostridia bacterium]|nr:hypothetical protein [Clostridia bacterium]